MRKISEALSINSSVSGELRLQCIMNCKGILGDFRVTGEQIDYLELFKAITKIELKPSPTFERSSGKTTDRQVFLKINIEKGKIISIDQE